MESRPRGPMPTGQNGAWGAQRLPAQPCCELAPPFLSLQAALLPLLSCWTPEGRAHQRVVWL